MGPTKFLYEQELMVHSKKMLWVIVSPFLALGVRQQDVSEPDDKYIFGRLLPTHLHSKTPIPSVTF